MLISLCFAPKISARYWKAIVQRLTRRVCLLSAGAIQGWRGTNTVICSRNTAFVPHFGPQRLAYHAAELAYCELSDGNAAFDIDTGRDLLGLLACRNQLDSADPIAIILEDDRPWMKIAQCCA